MKKYIENFIVFALGAIIYSMIEIWWRGHTHWTMGIAGGVCLTGIYLLRLFCPDVHIGWRCLAGAVFICTVEYFTGVIVNLILGWNVWDYSSVPYNVYGQICPLYALFWFIICVPGDIISGYLSKVFGFFRNRVCKKIEE